MDSHIEQSCAKKNLHNNYYFNIYRLCRIGSLKCFKEIKTFFYFIQSQVSTILLYLVKIEFLSPFS